MTLRPLATFARKITKGNHSCKPASLNRPIHKHTMFRFLRSTNLKQNEAQSSRADSTHKGVNQRSKDVTQAQQQRPKSPTENVPVAGLMYLVFTRLPGESYRRQVRSFVELMRDKNTKTMSTHTPQLSEDREERAKAESNQGPSCLTAWPNRLEHHSISASTHPLLLPPPPIPYYIPTLYLMSYYTTENDPCVKTGSDASHFHISLQEGQKSETE